MNFMNKFFLVEAEKHRVSRDFVRAMDCYDRAIELAHQAGFIHEEALANERAAGFYLESGKPSVAQGYLQAARYCWLRWGATEKVKDLEEEYSEHLATRTITPLHRTTDVVPVTGTASTMTGSKEGLDLASVMKASRIISGEIVRKQLLEELVRVVIENAGAQKGFLILPEDGTLCIEAAGLVGEGGIDVLKSIPIESSQELSTSIVNYVARTRETVVLDDAVHDGGFTDDPYVTKTGAKSVLCSPIIHKGDLTAIVYLENNLTTAAFTPGRVEVLRLLGSQAAVSLENARLYENLELRVVARTAELEKANVDLKMEIDEKRRAQEAFCEAKVTAEKTNRAKSEFLANMSHELRTPLNAVIGFSELLEDQSYGGMNTDQLTYVSQIHGAGEHLLQLINDILDLAKVESGRLELQISSIDLAVQLPNSLSMIKEKAHKHGIKLDLRISDELQEIRVPADEVKFKQIMFNLLSNAVKFTPDGGSVTVEARLESGYVVVSVSDTGIGIRSEDREKIFGAFEQVDSSHARRQQGTGLGLALTRRLAELHGGRILVESPGLGKGSTFEVVLPLDISAHPPIRPPESVSLAPDVHDAVQHYLTLDDDRPLVLVVDDDPGVGQLITRYLTSAGYRAVQAFNGEQAVEAAARLSPIAITLDVMMPGKGGLDVLIELKSAPETKDIPVVMVTVTDDREIALALGAVDFLVKPVDSERLIEAMDSAIASRWNNAGKILVIDAEPQQVDLLCRMLHSRGLNLLRAYGGKEGLKVALTEKPDLIILDLLMPDMNGFEVVEELRKHPETSQTPVFVHTAADLTTVDKERLRFPVRAFSSKSGGTEALLDHLGLLRKGRPNG